MIAVTPCTVQVELPSRPAESYGPEGNRIGSCRPGRPRCWPGPRRYRRFWTSSHSTNKYKLLITAKTLLWARGARTQIVWRRT